MIEEPGLPLTTQEPGLPLTTEMPGLPLTDADLHEKLADKLLDLFYDSFNTLLNTKAYGMIDGLISSIDARSSDFDNDILLGILTATLPAKSKLPARENLLKNVRTKLVAEKLNPEEILEGL